MEAFDDISGVHDSSNLLVVLKIAAQARPVLLPGLSGILSNSKPIALSASCPLYLSTRSLVYF